MTDGTVFALGPNLPPVVREGLEGGGTVLLSSRASNPDGKKARRSCTKQAHSACRQLETLGAFEGLVRAVGTQAQLSKALQLTQDIMMSEDAKGTEFKTRWVSQGVGNNVHILLCCGSATKTTLRDFIQPAMLRLAQEVQELDPWVVALNEPTRISRSSVGAFCDAMWRVDKRHPVYLLHNNLLVQWDLWIERQIVNEALGGRQEASSFRDRIGTSALVQAESHLPRIDGVVPFPYSSCPPPPLTTCWRTDGDGQSRGEHSLCQDIPGLREALAPIAHGLSKVVHPRTGKAVDQSELIRRFCSRAGQPGVSTNMLIRELVADGLSTPGLRRRTGRSDARFDSAPLTPKRCNGIARVLVSHLDFFVTGVLTVNTERGPVQITGLMRQGVDEPLATPEDRVRIEAMVERHRFRFSRQQRWTFGGHPVTREGVPQELGGEVNQDEVVYRTRSRGVRHRFNDPRPVIPHRELVASLVRGLVSCADDLRALAPEHPVGVTEEEQKVGELESRVSALGAESKTAIKNLARTTKEVVRKMLEKECADLDTELALAKAELSKARTKVLAVSQPDPVAVRLEGFLALLNRLRDPTSIDDHELLRQSLGTLIVGSRVLRRGGLPVLRSRWEGVFHLLVGETVLEVPVAGTHERVMLRDGARNSLKRVAQLRRGVPLKGKVNDASRVHLIQTLGVPHLAIPVRTIGDPTLLRIAMAILFPPLPDPVWCAGQLLPIHAGPALNTYQLAAAARRLDVPLALVRRVFEVVGREEHKAGAQRRWISKGDERLRGALTISGNNEGVITGQDARAAAAANANHSMNMMKKGVREVTPGLFEVTAGGLLAIPCPECGQRRWDVLSIREATLPICLTCRLDADGIHWPVNPYDRYRIGSARTVRTRGTSSEKSRRG